MGTMNFALLDNENQLIEWAALGDLEAFNEIVLYYQDAIYHYVLSLLHDPDLAEDVTQDGFLRAFQNLKRFRGGSFRGWLFRIVTNLSFDLLRQRKRRPTIPLYPEDEYGQELDSANWLIDSSLSVHESIERDETSNQLYRALDEMPQKYRSVMILVDLYEFDYTDAAKTLGIPLGTVKSRLARARLWMRDKLRREMLPVRAVHHGTPVRAYAV